MDDQHFATSTDLERTRAEVIERMGQLEVRMVEQMRQLEVRLIERMAQLEVRLAEQMGQLEVRLVKRIEQTETRTLRWVAGLFAAQTFVLVAAVLGMIEVLR